ncbi:hypothetical protein FQA39_LY17396 [Lamprigera yunnana]|nr:hypothetical protein FQA39_LY17396 [Lamprigera yunnana]
MDKTPYYEEQQVHMDVVRKMRRASAHRTMRITSFLLLRLGENLRSNKKPTIPLCSKEVTAEVAKRQFFPIKLYSRGSSSKYQLQSQQLLAYSASIVEDFMTPVVLMNSKIDPMDVCFLRLSVTSTTVDMSPININNHAYQVQEENHSPRPDERLGEKQQLHTFFAFPFSVARVRRKSSTQ